MDSFIDFSFNTASGKRCCNRYYYRYDSKRKGCFNTASGKRCCNNLIREIKATEVSAEFQYRKR